MRRHPAPAVLVALAVAGCLAPPPPAPSHPPVAAHHPAPLDWFQQRLLAARQARLAHQPKEDTAGAQAAYDDAVRSACVQVALSGPEKYQARCAVVLKQSQTPPADPFPCDDAAAAADPDTLRSCND